MITELERRIIDALHEDAQRARLVNPDAPSTASLPLSDKESQARPHRWLIALAAATVLIVVAGLALIQSTRDEAPTRIGPSPTVAPSPTTDAPAPTTVSDSAPDRDDESAFADAIEASGVLTSPSPDEVAQATDDDLYMETSALITQVSATGRHVTLRTCRPYAADTCGTGWAYLTRSTDGSDVRGGLLGEASQADLYLHLLEDRYFVASQSSPDAQAPSQAWLIDAVSGQAGVLRWRDEPTTLNSPEQALLLCQTSYNTQCDIAHVRDDTAQVSAEEGQTTRAPTQAGLPTVVDARDGTIRPLAVPDNVVPGMPVAQRGAGRIWVGTDPDGVGLGLAYSDDGGATWRDVALPDQLSATREDLARAIGWMTIAADGDRVAAALSGGTVYVSQDAGQSWTTPTPSEPAGNFAHLYVLGDRRLVLMWSIDPYPVQVLVSTGSDWADLQEVNVDLPEVSPQDSKRFSVNRAGVAMLASLTPGTIDVSTDLTNWSTIEKFDDDR